MTFLPQRIRRTRPSFAPTPDIEVVVVGGGPGGSAVATLLAERGHEVMVLDKARFPRHKACSEYVNAEAALLLDQLGVGEEVRRAEPHRMERMIVHAPGGGRYAADFGRAEPGRAALGLSRYRLDALLLAHAGASGAVVREGAHVRALLVANRCVAGVEATIAGTREAISARLVIGADGRHSAVVRALGLGVEPRWPRRIGLVAHYRGVTGLGDYGEMHVGRGGYAGLAPLEDGLTNVAFVTGLRVARERSEPLEAFFAASLAALPAVAERLADAEPVGPVRGVGPLAHRARRTSGDGFLLVGDAAGFLDPFTGEGIYEALKAATLAAPIVSSALRQRDVSARALSPYAAARRRAFTAKRGVCWLVQGFIHSPPLMDYATARLASRDRLGLTLAGVLGDFRPATEALSPRFLAGLLRP